MFFRHFYFCFEKSRHVGRNIGRNVVMYIANRTNMLVEMLAKMLAEMLARFAPPLTDRGMENVVVACSCYRRS